MSEMTQLQQAIQAAFPQTELRMEEPLAQHTSFRIGGPCEVMAFPAVWRSCPAFSRWAHGRQLQPAILGSGTNVLAADAGRRGLVICTRGCLDGLEQVDGVHIRVLAGGSPWPEPPYLPPIWACPAWNLPMAFPAPWAVACI